MNKNLILKEIKKCPPLLKGGGFDEVEDGEI